MAVDMLKTLQKTVVNNEESKIYAKKDKELTSQDHVLIWRCFRSLMRLAYVYLIVYQIIDRFF